MSLKAALISDIVRVLSRRPMDRAQRVLFKLSLKNPRTGFRAAKARTLLDFDQAQYRGAMAALTKRVNGSFPESRSLKPGLGLMFGVHGAGDDRTYVPRPELISAINKVAPLVQALQRPMTEVLKAPALRFDRSSRSRPESRSRLSRESGRAVFVYRWGTNDALWEGQAPGPTAALDSLRQAAHDKLVAWSLGSSARAPACAKQICVGDIVLLYAGSKFNPRGIYAIATAGRSSGTTGHLAVEGRDWRLPLTMLPASQKLARAPFTGFDAVLAPGGPASTLLKLNEPPRAIKALIEWALGASPTRPASASSTRSRGGAPISSRARKELDELPDAERRRVQREIEQVIRDARLRARVIDLWGPACAACGLRIEAAPTAYECEAAHVREVWDGGKDLLSNAMPLCRTHHWAFDQHLWAIQPTTMRINVAPDWREHDALRGLHKQLVVRPTAPGGIEPLSKKSLVYRWRQFERARL